MRIEGNTAKAILSSTSMRSSYVVLKHVSGSWRIVDLLGELAV